MFFVKLYNKDNKVIFNAEFSSRDQAVKYFNLKLDQSMFFETVPFMKYDRIEICEDNTVIFDYEV